MSVTDLEKLISLRDKGDLSAEEFARLKSRLFDDKSADLPSQPPEPRSAGWGSTIGAIVGIVIVIFFWFAEIKDAKRADEIETASSPNELVSLLINEADAKVEAKRSGSLLSVSYSLAPWALTVSTTKSTFNLQTSEIVPKVFKRFPDIQQIEITGIGSFRDARGHESIDPALRVKFTRVNADTVNWEKVYSADIPKIADRFWMHPSLRDN